MIAQDFVIKEVGKKRYLVIDFTGKPYVASIADYAQVMAQVIDVLKVHDADIVVLAETYERIYNEEQTAYLKEIASLARDFEREALWVPSKIGSGEGVQERYNVIADITTRLIKEDPVQAYVKALVELSRIKKKYETLPEERKKEISPYIRTLQYIIKRMEEKEFFKKVKVIIRKLGKMPTDRSIYRAFFEAEIKPAFFAARVLFREMEKLELVDQYEVDGTQVRIFRHPEMISYLYYINPPEYNLPPEKYFLMTKTKEIVAAHKPRGIEFADVKRVREYFENLYEATILDLAKENNIKISGEEVRQLAKLVARYTIGYGILEIFFSDRRVTDVYLDAPLGQKPVYLVHGEYGQCTTNVIFTEEEAKAIVSRFRAISGRPFDEAHPVLDLDLTDLQVRVAVIGRPLSPDGIAFAFRLHKVTPWTLPQFIDVKMLNPLAAGLLSFLVDSQASILVVGSRGAGKTSLLQALMLEILQNLRILVQEDTLELPVPYMKRIGFNIQRLKTRPAIGAPGATSEVAPEEALRTALRLGDSVLIVGEVRSKEAQTLFEAMRVGAVGNVVMGTIHGESAYSVWDRIVNDLGVPTTSFKATTHIVVAAPIRFKGSLKRHRRVVEVVEVGKHWTHDPEAEGAFYTLLRFNASKDTLELVEEGWKKSEFFPRLMQMRGLTMEEIWADINMRAESKAFLVSLKREHNVPELLEAEYTVRAHNKLLLMRERMLEETGSVDYERLLSDWKKWVVDVLLKEVLARRPT